MERRPFLKRVLLGAAYGLAALLLAYPVLSFMTFRKVKKREISFDAKDRAATVHFKEGVYLIEAQDGPFALSGRCTHLGCILNHDPLSQRFVCPCHGSVFEISGRWISGPAKKDLLSLPISSGEDGRIVVTLTY